MAGKKSIAQSGREDSARQQDLIRGALAEARTRLRWRIALRGTASSFWLAALAAAGWAAAVRFTLLDMPRWPVVAILLAWLVAFLVWLFGRRITTAQCAHYLDSTLTLDERVTTCLELEGRARFGEGSATGASFYGMLVTDTALLLTERMALLPGRLRLRSRVWRSLASTVAVLSLAAVLFIPTQLDAIKTERDVVRTTLEAQAQNLADLRAELIARPGLPEDLKNGIASKLNALEKQLRSQQIGRADALASIADTEQEIRSLAPPAASSDFDPVLRAAGLVQNSAVDTMNSGKTSTGETSDFASAEEAIKSLKSALNKLTPPQARGLATALERAANEAAPKDPQLAQDLLDAAAAIRKSDWAKASSSLDDASKRFQDATVQQQSAQAIENTLSKLEDGRQSIAKAGATANKRGQVGFRGGNTAQAGADNNQAANPAGTPDASQSSSLIGARIGQNQPAFGSNPASGGAGSGQQSTQQGTSGGANGSGSGQGGKPVVGGSNPAQQSAGSGGGTGTGSQGTNQGRISGPIGGGGGSQNPTGDAEGNGISRVGAQTSQSTNQSSERVYVPGQIATQSSGMAGQAAPEQNPNATVGKSGDGTAGETLQATSQGLGSITTIHTPYKQVLGQYSEQAIQALDKAYVPPDAKEYVRNYFSALDK